MSMSRKGACARSRLLLAVMWLALVGCPNPSDPDGNQYAPKILVTQNSIDISNGSQFAAGGCVLNTSKDLTFKIKNVGTADLSLTGSPRVAISGVDLSVFAVTAQPVAQIPPGGSASFTLRFTPTEIGLKTAVLTVDCNDPLCASYSFTLTGEGTTILEPEIHISQGSTPVNSGGSFELGNSLVGVGKEMIFTVENRGSGDLRLDADPKVAISGPNEALFIVSAQPASPIAAGESGSFGIRFTPDSTGPKSAMVSIPTNDTDLDYFTFTVTATGTVSDIDITQSGTAIASGGSFDLGSSLLGAGKDVSFVVENRGTGPLILTDNPPVAIDGAHAAMFQVTVQPSSPIAAGESGSFTIRFTPSTPGGKTASVAITNNDPDSGAFEFTVKGVGAVVPVPKTGQTVSYGARDDGALQKGFVWPSPRFTDNGNSTMTDNLTALTWEKSPLSTLREWVDSFPYASSLSLGGHTDWRVPNAKELRSLINYGSSPSTWLAAQGFISNADTLACWTSTSASNGYWEWALVMGTGYLMLSEASPMSGFPSSVWAVRGDSTPLAKTGQTTSYDSADDGALRKGATWPIPRFTDNGDGTMTDSLTGLVWEKNPNAATRTWAAALTYANGLSLGGRTDWRLPNINELETLVIYEDTIASTWLTSQGFTNVQTLDYWSSSTYAGNTSHAWSVRTSFGSEDPATKTDAYYAWAVRGGN